MAQAEPNPFAHTLENLPEQRLQQTRFGCAALAVVLCLGIGLRLRDLSDSLGRSPDETVYTRQANTLRQQGTAGLRGLAAQYLRDPSVRPFPPPTRAVYLWMLVATMRWSGRTDEPAGTYLSCAASIGSLFVLALIGIRFFPGWATLFGVLFFAVSPAELELARRTWGDSLAGFLGLALLYAAAEITHHPQRRIWHAAFVALGALESVVKESGPIVFGLCMVWILWVILAQKKRWRDGLVVLLAGLAGSMGAVLWLAHSLGGVTTLTQIVTDWLQANATNGYALEYQSGPGYLLLETMWIASPIPSVFFLIGLLVSFLSRGRRNAEGPEEDVADRPVLMGMSLFVLSFLALPMILPHWLNLRYISVLYGPFYLLGGVGFWYCAAACWRINSGLYRPALAAALIVALVAGAFTNYRRFHTMLVQGDLGDLSVKLLLDSARLASTEARVKKAPTAENYLSLCVQYERQERYKDSIAACQHSVQIRPDLPEPYSEMAAAYNGLGMWDEAVAAAQQALKIRPGLPLAQDNLELALQRQKLAETEGARQP